MAITLDDLPFAYARQLTVDEQRVAFESVLEALEKHAVSAAGFVNGVHLTKEKAAWLDAFAEAGHRIGNHTFSHPDLHKMSVSDYMQDVDKGEESIRKWLGTPKYFRYPFLHRGTSPAIRDGVYTMLCDRGYEIASVSIDNDDYLFNKKLVDARARDKELDLRDDYIGHILERSRYFEALAMEKLGRPIKHVLLLHMNYLNALYLDDLLQAFRDAGWTFVSMPEALNDPVYALPDTYAGPKGLSYLERIESANPDAAPRD